MKKIFALSALPVLLACLLQACITPPAILNWQTEPGKIQRVDCDPKSPYCQ